MTYKAIVKEIIRTEAQNWVEKLLEKNGIDYKFTSASVTDLENDKDRDTIFWTVKVDITVQRYKSITVEVGGTADDFTGICRSAIWTAGKKQILWMEVEETRNQLGIKEFKIA